MAVYKKEFRSLDGYLTDGCKVLTQIHVQFNSPLSDMVVTFIFFFYFDPLQPNLKRVEQFIQAVGSFEDKIFQKRARLHQVHSFESLVKYLYVCINCSGLLSEASGENKGR